MGQAVKHKIQYPGATPYQDRHGKKPIAQLERRHVQAMLAEKAETPAAANNLRKRLIQLLDHAISLDWRGDNPVRATKPYRNTGTGFHSWEEKEIAQFLRSTNPAHWPTEQLP
ncbi:hypothetical protein ACFP4H_11670 [Pseudophaeobacter arcticus]|uniref:hypothetical protein n=1 Tax=Pseudophaeobacter arcticus TaxID=385492 RepID=UPI000686A55E|nr:hypothetical protein [Pseudophaeobacter arcticus]